MVYRSEHRIHLRGKFQAVVELSLFVERGSSPTVNQGEIWPAKRQIISGKVETGEQPLICAKG